MTKKASDVLAKARKLVEKKEMVGDGGDASLRGIVEKMVKEQWSKDADSKKSAMGEMAKLAESDDALAKDFMEYMDKMSSSYKIKEAFDNSPNKGAKEADDEAEK